MRPMAPKVPWRLELLAELDRMLAGELTINHYSALLVVPGETQGEDSMTKYLVPEEGLKAAVEAMTVRCGRQFPYHG